MKNLVKFIAVITFLKVGIASAVGPGGIGLNVKHKKQIVSETKTTTILEATSAQAIGGKKQVMDQISFVIPSTDNKELKLNVWAEVVLMSNNEYAQYGDIIKKGNSIPWSFYINEEPHDVETTGGFTDSILEWFIDFKDFNNITKIKLEVITKVVLKNSSINDFNESVSTCFQETTYKFLTEIRRKGLEAKFADYSLRKEFKNYVELDLSSCELSN